MAEFEKSLVGDPVLWKGLVYSPLNVPGLIFALGTIATAAGLIFEEFSVSGQKAICRRKTDNGWERIRIAFAVKSSDFSGNSDGVDLLVCWSDDIDGENYPPRFELSKFSNAKYESVQNISPLPSSKEIPDNVREEFLSGSEVRESFEETIRELDSRIKKLKSP